MFNNIRQTQILLNGRPMWILLGLLLFILLLQLLVDLLREPHELVPVRVDRTAELQRIFDTNIYQWPPENTVPQLGVISLPPGLRDLEVKKKKSIFFRTLLPLTLAENRRLREQREFIEYALNERNNLSGGERQRLEEIAHGYGIEGDLEKQANHARLLRRVDIVPPALVLAQAANESGWGTSRFALEANNLFGVWTYKATQGLAPRERADDAGHFVRIYPSLQRAVRDYMHNLNVGHAYEAFRQRRAAMRDRGESLDALSLAGTLQRYSQRGEAYVEELRSMIRSNGLNQLDGLRLAE